MGETTRRQRSKKPVAKYQPSVISIHNQDIYSLEFDGASKGNPGKAGAGAILKSPDGTVVCQLTKGVGIATCNFAEYQALIMGLQAALDRGIRHIKAQGDSKLVCSQVMGSWKVHSPNLSTSFSEAVKLKQRFQSFSIQHVYRKFNSAADTLANTAVGLPVDKPQIHCTISPDHTNSPEKSKGSKLARDEQSFCRRQDVSGNPIKLSRLSQEKKEVYRINYHGASNGKRAGAGVAIFSPDGALHFKLDQGLGLETRNVAQYQALVIGLRAALECKASYIQIQGDALLVFKQMTGTVKVKDERLEALWKEANALLTSFSEFSITHVDKCQNSVACALAEVALQSPDCRSRNDDAQRVRTSFREGRSNMGGGDTLKIQTCSAGSMTLYKMASPLGTSRRRFSESVCCARAPMWSSALFFPYCRESSRFPRLQAPQPVPKCLPLYMPNIPIHKIVVRHPEVECIPNIPIHKIVLQCASKRVRIIPHIFQSSLMHIQAGGALHKPALSSSVFQVSLKRSL